MINLLPPELKDGYMYGRRNTTLRKWATALSFGLVGVIVITLAGMLYMQQSISSYRAQVAQTQAALKEQNIDQTRQQAKDITSSVKLAVDVLSREVLFSKLITQIATVIPANASLTDLSISKDLKIIEIKAQSTDYTSATQLQVNLEDPTNKIFSKADIQNIDCSGAVPGSRYPCKVVIRALFNDDNPFLFINKEGAAR